MMKCLDKIYIKKNVENSKQYSQGQLSNDYTGSDDSFIKQENQKIKIANLMVEGLKGMTENFAEINDNNYVF